MSGAKKGRGNARSVDREAAAWILRWDRGLTAEEQDQFSQWLAADPRHGGSLARHGRAWARLDRLDPSQMAPDLGDDFAAEAGRESRMRRLVLLPLGAAAAIALFACLIRYHPSRSPLSLLEGPAPAAIEKRVLEDGSIVRLNEGAVVKIDFSPTERRVSLKRGEAHFTVAKNPARPFVVEAGAVRVRAVGTAFDVRLDESAVAVLVTEGKVQIRASQPAERRAGPAAPPPIVRAGERAVVSLAAPQRTVEVTALPDAEIERLFAWQPRLLDYTAAPLSEIVARFNQCNVVQLTLADPDLAAVRITASLRSDNIEGFVHLLEAGFGVHAEHRGPAEIVLRQAP